MQSTETTLRGSVMVLLQYDVAEAIRLDLLQELVSARKVAKPSMKHPAPGYVRYQRPPVVVPVESLVLESGEQLHGEIKYYDYGVLSVVFELPFSGGWDKLTALASRWVWDVDFAAQATAIVRASLERAAPALIKPYERVAQRRLPDLPCPRDFRLAHGHRADSASTARASPRWCAATPANWPRASATKCCNRASPTTPTTWP